MRILFSCLICFCFLGRLSAQADWSRMEQLELSFHSATSDTARMRILQAMLLSEAQMNHPEKVRNYGQQALRFAEHWGAPLEKARVYHAIGTAYLYLDNADSAITALETSRSIIKNDNSIEGRKLYAMSTGNLSNAYSFKGFETRALELLIDVLPVFEATRDTLNYAITLHNVANKFINKREYTKAFPYLTKGIHLLEQTSYPYITGFYLTAANMMYDQDSLERMNYFLNKAAGTLPVEGNPADSGRYFAYKAGYCVKMKQFDAAEDLCRRAIALQATYPNRSNLYAAFVMLQFNYSEQGNYMQALRCADTLHQMATEDLYTDFLLSSLQDLSIFSFKTGRLSDAYRYLSEYTALKDSVDKEETLVKLSEVEQHYQSSQKEQQIMQLRNNAKIQRLLFWGAVALALMILLFFLYRAKQKKIRSAQALQSFNQQKEIEVTQALLTGEERERSRLARELHDGLGGMLAGVKMNLAGIADKAPATFAPAINDTVRQLGNSVNELRHIARNLMPESLLRSGLQGALRDLCESYVTDRLRIVLNTFQVNDSVVPQHQLIIYRMIQELLANAIKHSGADKIMVQCTQAEETFFITVEDNGKGFDSNRDDFEGMGLKNIRSRVNFLKGNIHTDSSAEGTIINIELNINNG